MGSQGRVEGIPWRLGVALRSVHLNRRPHASKSTGEFACGLAFVERWQIERNEC